MVVEEVAKGMELDEVMMMLRKGKKRQAMVNWLRFLSRTYLLPSFLPVD